MKLKANSIIFVAADQFSKKDVEQAAFRATQYAQEGAYYVAILTMAPCAYDRRVRIQVIALFREKPVVFGGIKMVIYKDTTLDRALLGPRRIVDKIVVVDQSGNSVSKQ